MTQMNFLKKAALFSGVAMICFAAPAKAGFEWRGPIEPPAAAAPAPEAMDNQGMQGQDMQGMPPVTAPVTAMDAEMAPEPVPQQAAAPATAAPVQSAPIVAAVPPAEMTPSYADQGEVISGFGAGLPLVIALQQVVPPGYQYSFSGDVNPGVSVSWEGGKPWQQVLSDMLAPQGLGYRLQGNAVVIGRFAPQETQAAPVSYAQAPEMTPSSDMSGDLAPVMIASPGKAEQIPAEMAAPPQEQSVDPSTISASTAPVTIRRQKPSSLLERLGWARKTEEERTENIAVPRGDAPISSGGDAAASSAPASAPPPEWTQQPAPAEATQMAAVTPPEPVKQASATPASWGGAKGDTLRDVLKTWSDKAGVELYWSIDYDYRLSRDVGYSGTYDEAVGSLLDQFASVRPQPYGQLHQSANGPRVLVVKSYDLTR